MGSFRGERRLDYFSVKAKRRMIPAPHLSSIIKQQVTGLSDHSGLSGDVCIVQYLDINKRIFVDETLQISTFTSNTHTKCDTLYFQKAFALPIRFSSKVSQLF